MYIKDHKTRLVLVSTLFIVILSFLLIRLIYIQIICHSSMSRKALGQHLVVLELPPKRGAILDRNLKPLALSLRVDSIYAVATDVKNKREAAQKLSKILDKKAEFLYERLSRDKQFVWLARKVPIEVTRKVQALGIDGISFIDESKRFYPEGVTACHVVGFAGTDNAGLEGLELLFDKYLKGSPGEKAIARDARGRSIPSLTKRYIPPTDGCSLVLTIDDVIQHITEGALDKAYKKFHAKAATAIVMDPKNGDILALANRPNYNLNNFNASNADSRKDTAVCSYFEPGSVFKIVTASACLQEHVTKFSDVYYCENGSWYVRGHTLHDHRPHGNLTFKEVIELSSNIGTVKAAMRLGEQKLYEYIKLFGLGASTGIDLPGEISGSVMPPSKWSKSSITTIPMGHGVAATPIQMACVASVIANKGNLIKPRIINKIIDSKGQLIMEFPPVIKRKVISEDIAAQMTELMEGVITEGTGTMAAMTDYTSAGKTGTASKVEPTGGYSKSRYVGSFVGFAPADNPAVVIYVMLDEPHPQYFGGTVAGPAFKEIASATLRYLQIPTQEESVKEKKLAVKKRAKKH